MKRMTLLAATAMVVFASCQKEKIEQSPTEPSFRFESVNNGSNSTINPGPKMVFASYVFEGKNAPELGIDQISIKTAGTVTYAKLRNIKGILKYQDSSVVWRDSVTSFSFQTGMVQFQPIGNTILIDKPGKYVLTISGDVMDGTYGTLSVLTQVRYSWKDEYGFIDDVSNFISGPTITFGHPIAPMVTTAVPVNKQVVEGDDVGASVNVISLNGPSALKQSAYRILYADNGTNNTIELDSLRFIKGNTDITSFVTFSDSLGNKVTKLSETNPAHRKVYVTITAGGTMNGQAVFQPGVSEDLDFVATIRGIGTNADGDAVSITPLTDAAPPVANASYLVKGTGADVRARLATSPTAAGTLYNFIWSDLSANPHSALFGVSSGDWKNGFGITFNVVPSIYHSRRMN